MKESNDCEWNYKSASMHSDKKEKKKANKKKND